MKAENVTSRKDLEFFGIMSHATNAWTHYYRMQSNYEAHPIRANQRAFNRACRAARAAQQRLAEMANQRGYTL